MHQHTGERGVCLLALHGGEKTQHHGAGVLLPNHLEGAAVGLLLVVRFQLLLEDHQLMRHAVVLHLLQLLDEGLVEADAGAHLDTVVQALVFVHQTVHQRHHDSLAAVIPLLQEPLELLQPARLLLTVHRLVHLLKRFDELPVRLIGDVAERRQQLPDVPLRLGLLVVQTLDQGQGRMLRAAHHLDCGLAPVHETPGAVHKVTQQFDVRLHLLRLAQHRRQLEEQGRDTALVDEL
mmetsp:Transcript_10147/g.28530  ORF Transcript_10147/g.28530 Transcript_10147/m.28530 type:complete len:235 (-) Transcript_10147:507-1211(-)